MLENQKKWCHEKLEKGKKWVSEHKEIIIFGAGCASSAAINILISKILEDKETGISFGSIIEEDGKWSDDFYVETYGINRFGRRNHGRPAVFDQDKSEWIAEHARMIVKDINEHNGKNV